MKKIVITTLASALFVVSVCEAQSTPSRKETAKKQYVEPPPPPPPPPAAPMPPNPPKVAISETPPIPPVPPVPPVPEDEVAVLTPPTIIKDLSSSGVNDKGYELWVRTVNRSSVVIVKKKGARVKTIPLETWLANNKMYEDLYGELPPPPPPPPPPAPRAPNKGNS